MPTLTKLYLGFLTVFAAWAKDHIQIKKGWRPRCLARRTYEGRFIISRPGPSAWWEIIKYPEMRVHIDDVMDVC